MLGVKNGKVFLINCDHYEREPVSYQDGRGPVWRTVCIEEGAAVVVSASLTHLTSVANVLY